MAKPHVSRGAVLLRPAAISPSLAVTAAAQETSGPWSSLRSYKMQLVSSFAHL